MTFTETYLKVTSYENSSYWRGVSALNFLDKDDPSSIVGYENTCTPDQGSLSGMGAY